MSWEKVKLGDIATFSNGINFGKDAYSSGVKLITVSDFGNLYYPDYASLNEVDEKVLRKNDYLKDGDIVFVRSNGNKELVGRCMLISNPPAPVTYSGFCIRARLNDTQLNAPHFFAYYFKSQIFRKAMSNSAVGANIQNLNQGLLSNHILSLPPLKEQKRIADILSAYDNLIENNQKQIKLLEEAAQRLYKQWFIDLRYPGHETTPIVDGLPQGWKRCRMDEKFKTVLGGTPSRTNPNYWNGNVAWINSGEVNNLRIMKASECITELALEKSATKMMPVHTTVLAITGATLGQVSYTEIETCANQSVVGIIDETELFSMYLYLFVSTNIKSMIGKATGGAQQHINKDIVNEYKIILPEEHIIKKMNVLAAPLFNKIADCYRQIEKLTESRDRLLPKLMSSEIEV